VSATGYTSGSWLTRREAHPIKIPASELSDIPRSHLREAKPGPSDNDVISIPEVFVQLSCLNLARQYVFRWDYDVSGARSLQGSDDVVLERVDKCLQRLRVAFMCWSDVTPILKPVDAHGDIISNGDLRTLHYCRDFDRILRWTERNGLIDRNLLS